MAAGLAAAPAAAAAAMGAVREEVLEAATVGGGRAGGCDGNGGGDGGDGGEIGAGGGGSACDQPAQSERAGPTTKTSSATHPRLRQQRRASGLRTSGYGRGRRFAEMSAEAAAMAEAATVVAATELAVTVGSVGGQGADRIATACPCCQASAMGIDSCRRAAAVLRS